MDLRRHCTVDDQAYGRGLQTYPASAIRGLLPWGGVWVPVPADLRSGGLSAQQGKAEESRYPLQTSDMRRRKEQLEIQLTQNDACPGN